MSAIYQNFLSGTLTADPGVGGVTLNSANFAGMQAVATTATPDFMWVTLDPDGINGAPEVVKVTAHTAAATSVTVGRAQLGTVARAHPIGTAWQSAPTDADFEQITLTPRSGFRNAIINGGFDVWQRGGGAFTGGYTADMWKLAATGSTSSVSRQTFTPGNTIPGYEPAYYLRDACTSVAGAGNFHILLHYIEGVRSFAGQTCTLSFWAKADAAKNIAVEFEQAFGSGGGSAGVTTIGSQLVALTTSWKRYSLTIAIPSISGKTIGTGGDDALRLNFWMDAGATFAARAASLGQQSGTFDFWGVQLEAGSYETPFERRPLGAELALCQRYYEKSYDMDTAPGTATGVGAWYGPSRGATATSMDPVGLIQFKVNKRAVPSTISFWNSSGSANVWSVAGANVAVITNNPGQSCVSLYTTASAGLTAGTSYLSAGHWTASAEL